MRDKEVRVDRSFQVSDCRSGSADHVTMTGGAREGASTHITSVHNLSAQWWTWSLSEQVVGETCWDTADPSRWPEHRPRAPVAWTRRRYSRARSPGRFTQRGLRLALGSEFPTPFQLVLLTPEGLQLAFIRKGRGHAHSRVGSDHVQAARQARARTSRVVREGTVLYCLEQRWEWRGLVVQGSRRRCEFTQAYPALPAVLTSDGSMRCCTAVRRSYPAICPTVTLFRPISFTRPIIPPISVDASVHSVSLFTGIVYRLWTKHTSYLLSDR
jgi:hypothetical protein